METNVASAVGFGAGMRLMENCRCCKTIMGIEKFNLSIVLYNPNHLYWTLNGIKTSYAFVKQLTIQIPNMNPLE